MSAPLISVFTPAYNRADKIHRVFNSLVNQTFSDFEWIIVDDGSTDNTRSVIDQFIQKSPSFAIRYTYQENGGKHIAINKGLQLAKGEWFHIADSDDELEPQTLEVFMRTWDDIPEEKREKFCGVAACCKDQFGNRISDWVPGGSYDGNFRDLFYKHKFRKEVFMINKTEILRNYPFPEYIRNCYYPEAIVWRKMTDKYMLRFINDEMRIYHVNEANSLMSAVKSPRSKALSNCLETSDVLNSDLVYFRYAPVYFIKMAVVYCTFLPYLDAIQREWVNLRSAARRFASLFSIFGKMYRRNLEIKYKSDQNGFQNNAER
jgi:glycosyltransferase involved in cell wall biosynthesis